MQNDDTLSQQLEEEIRALVTQTSLSQEIKTELLSVLPTASMEKKANIKYALLVHMLIESQKEAIDKRRKEKKGLSTDEDLNAMVKEALTLVQSKEDQAISQAETTMIQKTLKNAAKDSS